MKDKSNLHVIYTIIQSYIIELLSLPNIQERIDEDEPRTHFNSLSTDQKLNYLSKLFPVGASMPELKLPLCSSLFKEPIREMISMICMIFGYENDIFVDDIILGFIHRLDQ